MSEFKLISPMLDNFAMGDSISEHDGVCCCPAMENDSDNRYIVKIVSTPASQSQLEALLLSGAYADNDAANEYFRAITDGIAEEAQILEKLSQLEGFLPFENWQVVPKEDGTGYDLYLLSQYRRTLQKQFKRSGMTHLGALNLGLDLCAALAVCRRLGYLYVDLKPENIYLTDDNEYRIGDLGFIKLDSLKYASLPDRYRSAYTPPEIADAFSALNTTMDTYALGLILYQAFNDSSLPLMSEDSDAPVLPPPAYADYEMSEIILKACAQDPEDRWQDPIQMGQALIGYMQRNGAHDTPIVPQATTEEPDNVEDTGLFEGSNDTVSIADSDEHAASEENTEIPVTEDDIYTEDENGNLTFIAHDSDDETAPDDNDVIEDYEQVTEEVNEMLNQADELIAHPAPEPVIQPDPIEVTLPDEGNSEPDTQSDEDELDAQFGENSAVEQEDEDCDSDNTDAEQTSASENESQRNSVDEDVSDTNSETNVMDTDCEGEESETCEKNHTVKIWIRNMLLILLALAVIGAGIFFYMNYYLQPIESIVLQDVEHGTLTVCVTSDIDESKLSVVCLDMYGNPLTAPVKDGKAVFTGLAPNSAYTVKININGFHRLTGDISASFTTPEETDIVQFQAVTGAENGSVILGFTVEGPDANQWSVRYTAPNEEEKEVAFTGHIATINGLTVGNEYTFTLVPDTELLLAGTSTITHTASNVIKAEGLAITGCIDGKLTAKWSAPNDTTAESWTVRCYNDKDYDQTIVVNQPSATFEGVDASVDHTVEVTAAGMSVSERAFAPANAITVTQFSLDTADANQFSLAWTATAEKNWNLLYSINGAGNQEINCGAETKASVRDIIPGSQYKFTIQATDGTPVLGGEMVYQVPEADSFSGYGVSAEQIQFKMCKTPAHKNWDRYDLRSSDYTTEFKIGKKASFLAKMQHEYDVSSDKVVTLYVIRDSAGTIISAASTTAKWSSMWSRNYGEFDIPALPDSVGEYTVSVYFDGALVHTQNFTMIS